MLRVTDLFLKQKSPCILPLYFYSEHVAIEDLLNKIPDTQMAVANELVEFIESSQSDIANPDFPEIAKGRFLHVDIIATQYLAKSTDLYGYIWKLQTLEGLLTPSAFAPIFEIAKSILEQINFLIGHMLLVLEQEQIKHNDLHLHNILLMRTPQQYYFVSPDGDEMLLQPIQMPIVIDWGMTSMSDMPANPSLTPKTCAEGLCPGSDTASDVWRYLCALEKMANEETQVGTFLKKLSSNLDPTWVYEAQGFMNVDACRLWPGYPLAGSPTGYDIISTTPVQEYKDRAVKEERRSLPIFFV